MISNMYFFNFLEYFLSGDFSIPFRMRLKSSKLATVLFLKKYRCSAINCNPKKGLYDKNILKILPKLNGVSNPSFGIKLKLISEGGTIKIDDEIKVLE